MAKVAFEGHSLGDLEGRDDAVFNLLSVSSGALAS